MDCFGKLYDAVLSNRLIHWFKPDREQAGAQHGRGCLEHIVTLRLLMDYVLLKRVKLYIIFVDFSKAYDRVPRDRLMRCLKALGCGARMMNAIAAAYSNTKLVLTSAVISATTGVRQGAPTSCFLFTLFVNPLIRSLKATAPDGFLQWLHTLMLMDDTIILATSRNACEEKFKKLLEYCEDYGMVINDKKTKLMVINGKAEDRRPVASGNIIVEHTQRYVYLGAVFTDDGKLATALQSHCDDKRKHVLKFMSFVQKNAEFPFCVKKKVLDAALLSSVLYSCESWIGSDSELKPVQQSYISAIKALLGVRVTAPNDICLVELGCPTATALIKDAQKRFFCKMLRERKDLKDDPLMFVWKLCKEAKTRQFQRVSALMETEDHKSVDIGEIKARILNSTRDEICDL